MTQVQILRVSPKHVVTIPLNKPTVIEDVTVTAFDADHCPGVPCGFTSAL